MKTEYIPLAGGVDQITAPLAIQPGSMLDCVNYEIPAGGKGYRYMNGYERYDGQPAPSDATYTMIYFENGSAEIVTDDEVEGSVSGATGTALIDAVLESGTYVGGDAEGYIVLGGVVGTFGVTDDLEVSSAKVGEVAASGVQADGTGATTRAIDDAWVELARAVVRARIAVPPGSGTPCGFSFGGYEYAIRDNAGNTAAVLYKSSSTGWAAQDLGEQLDFTDMTGAFTVGDTVTGAVSGATGVIAKIVYTSGSAGFLTITGVTDTFEAEAISDETTGAATASGASVANTLSPDGTYEFIQYNFRGATDSKSIYGVNGIDKAFEWDGTGFAFIETGIASEPNWNRGAETVTDSPTHLCAHKNMLFLSYSGGSIQHSSLTSSVTLPYVWDVILGAAELALGDDVTKFVSVAGQPLVIFAQNFTKLLYGSSRDDWELVDHSFEAGARAYTVQNIGQAIFVNNSMITTLSATDVYGDFSISGMSEKISKFLKPRIDNITSSVVSTEKSQYRLFFSDNYFIVMSFSSAGFAGFTFGEYADPVYNAWYNEDGEMFFGSTDGFIYQMDKGTSHDGAAMGTYMRLPFNFIGNPTIWKKFFKVIFEFDTSEANDVTFYFREEYDFMKLNLPTPETSTIDINAGELYWNVGDWNEEYWGGSENQEPPEASIRGISPQIGLLIWYSSAVLNPYTINGVIFEYTETGRRR